MSTMFEPGGVARASGKFANFPHSDPGGGGGGGGSDGMGSSSEDYSTRHSSSSAMSGDGSPYEMSPWNQTGSPFSKSPWTVHAPAPSANNPFNDDDSASFAPPSGLVSSLVREEGHIYSLAAAGELLYTGSDSKNIRVWKNQKEFAGFKSSSGLVKAIVISGGGKDGSDSRIFTGHQDGKIRVWKASTKNPAVHKRAGSLPKLKDYLKSSFKPSNYVEVRGKRNAIWIKHYDAVSCLSLSEDQGLLYSGSWDKTFKVWRISDSKCLESVPAHDDAVNSVVVGLDGLVFTGSADGTVKVWRRESGAAKGGTKHAAVQTLLKQESAVTALAVSAANSVLYCGSSDGVVNFWERDAERQLTHGGDLRGHKLAVLCLVTAGNILFSGSADKTICVWRRDGATGAHTCLSVLSGHLGPVKCLAVEAEQGSTPEEPSWTLYSGSLDKSIKVWRVSETAYNLMLQQQQQSFSSASLGGPSGDVGQHTSYSFQEGYSTAAGGLGSNYPQSYSSPSINATSGGNYPQSYSSPNIAATGSGNYPQTYSSPNIINTNSGQGSQPNGC